jgi:hypothetical protein
MKKHTRELNVDVIGGQRTLTKEEELAITKYLQSKKTKKKAKKTPSNLKVKAV